MIERSTTDHAVRAFVARDDSPAAMKRVNRLLDQHELQIRHYPAFQLDDASLWSSKAERSFGRMSHGFLAGADWLGAGRKLNDQDKGRLANAVTVIIQHWKLHDDPEASMAFHDETTAQRVINLASFKSDYSLHLSDIQSELIQSVIDEDTSLLMEDSFYAGNNNHGMFQNIALLVASEINYADDHRDTLRSKAISRLRHYFSTCFTADGVHIENNPTYHVMVSRYLARVVKYAETVGYGGTFSGLSSVLTRAEIYAAHAVTPRGEFPPISDTAVMPLNSGGLRTAYPGQTFLGAITGGKRGLAPKSRTYVAQQSGYGIHRSSWADRDASFVFFSAAYNANYHKHSDELSIYVLNDGIELVREAGPYGYDRSNPFTGYGFSSHAHNTLIVNGTGLPRTDDKSHLTSLEDKGSTETSLHLIGSTERYHGVKWSRELKVGDSGVKEPLHVQDVISSDSQHEYKMLWHFGPEVVPLARGNAVELFSKNGDKLAELTWSGEPSARVHLTYGKKTPNVQGWIFPTKGEASPAYVLEVEFDAADLTIDWEMRTTDFKIRDRGLNATKGPWESFIGEKPVNYFLDVPNEEFNSLAIAFTSIHEQGDFTYNYKSSLESFPGAKLFILDDFGDQGAYYLANGRQFSEYRSVQGLIKSVMRRLNIGSEQVTCLGSSKGGSAAILHGTALGAARVIAGAPQTKIGTFLSTAHPNILQYISGGTSASDVRWVDSVMTRTLASGVRSTSIDIVVGEADHHYGGHVIPFAGEAKALGYDVTVRALPGTPHSRIGSPFRSYIESWSDSSIGTPEMQVLPHATSYDPGSGVVGAVVSLPENWTIAFRLIRDRKVVDRIGYGKKSEARFVVNSSGQYRFRIFARPPEGDTVAFGTRSMKVQLKRD